LTQRAHALRRRRRSPGTSSERAVRAPADNRNHRPEREQRRQSVRRLLFVQLESLGSNIHAIASVAIRQLSRGNMGGDGCGDG
jgi:hypothetical protein